MDNQILEMKSESSIGNNRKEDVSALDGIG